MDNAHWFFTTFPQTPTAFPATLDLQDEDLAHHLKTVMRVKPGQKLVLVNIPESRAYAALFQGLSGKSLTVSIEAILPDKPKTGPKTVAAVSLIKGQRWDWMLQKLTELGIDEIIPLETERSIIEVKNPESKKSRWQDIVKNAAEQSERLSLPVIHPPVALKSWLDVPMAEETLKIVASERGGQPLHEVCSGITPKTCTVVFAIGPEGGWAEGELALLAERGFHAVHFGDTIFRSETAALYLQAVLQYVSHTHASTR